MPDYYDGKREGIRLYAWWKDGKQYVGTTGTTLKEALKEVSKEKEKAWEKAWKEIGKEFKE